MAHCRPKQFSEARLLGDLLANCMEWDVQDLRSEFLSVVARQSSVSKRRAAMIFDQYFGLPKSIQLDPAFDRVAFVESVAT